MMNYLTKGLSLIFLITLVGSLINVFAQSRRTSSQSAFSAESSLSKQVRIPQSALASIRLFEDNLSENAEFEGVLINLNNDRLPDLLVQGDQGANITGFWLFRNTGGKYKMVLAARAHGLSIKKTATKSFRNIDISAMSAVTVWETTYNFNGVKYIPKVCSELNMNDRRPRKKLIPCRQDSAKPYR